MTFDYKQCPVSLKASLKTNTDPALQLFIDAFAKLPEADQVVIDGLAEMLCEIKGIGKGSAIIIIGTAAMQKITNGRHRELYRRYLDRERKAAMQERLKLLIADYEEA